MDFTRQSTENSGILPEKGKYSVKRWAEFFDTSDATIRRWLKKYKVPFFKPGDTMFVEAVDFLNRIPYHDLEDPEPDLEE